MKKLAAILLSMVVVFCVSCNRDESLKETDEIPVAGYKRSTLSFSGIKFLLDITRTNLDIHLEVTSDITDDAFILFALSDFSASDIQKDEIFTIKGYKGGYSIDNFSIRSYGVLPVNLNWQIPKYVSEKEYEYLLSADWFSELSIPFGLAYYNGDIVPNDRAYYMNFEESSSPFDFPVYFRKIYLKKGKNIEKATIKFEQPLDRGVNDPGIYLYVLRMNEKIKNQIESYPDNYQLSLSEKILYNQYFKAFPDSSLVSFVFSRADLIMKMSKTSDGEYLRKKVDDKSANLNPYYNVTGVGTFSILYYFEFLEINQGAGFTDFLYDLYDPE